MSPKPLVPPLAACLALLVAPPGAAAPSLELGSTSEGSLALSVNLDTLVDLDHWHPGLALRLGTGLLLLPGDDGDDNAAWRLTPALRYAVGGPVFLEAGVGGALFLETELGGQALSNAFQFENRLALGIRLGQGSEMGVAAVHHSNAHMDWPNDGFEIYSLVYRQAL
ncbi:acyloxyacyl hydrolase [Halomonas beimenensis]|uniref:Acyloxyacyl hydrolase n=1 Tax=Halomonas beimenensis TaxID=475662 RepID=A0A291PCU2_9GAMM|nr:acyloxyacyl hydrolase [Halomonas beimenensis]ATJ84726.1 hypothetical protein BEI_3739 [Halomonas beimenensis]